MFKRIASSVALLPLLILIIYLRGTVLDVSVMVVTCIGLFELFRAFENKGVKPMFKLSLISVFAIFLGIFMNWPAVYFLFVVSLFTLILMLINLFGKSEHIQDIAYTALGFIYIVIPFVHITLINRLDSLFLLIYVFILAWVSDTFAYFFGRAFGKHKLLPSVSPNKTVEGFVAGVVCTTIVSMTYAYFVDPKFFWYALPLGLFGSMAGTVGDLIASKIKRVMDIKDYGKLIPGHGGVLDRFDSIMLTAPVVYYIAYLYTAAIR